MKIGDPVLVIGKILLRFCRNDLGASAVFTALMMPIVLGFVGLGIDVGLWYAKKRDLQSAADSAAISAAMSYLSNSNINASTVMGNADAVRGGFDATAGTIAINITDGGETAGGSAEVILTEPQKLFFSSVFMSEPITIKSRAVANAVVGTGKFCMLALDTAMDKAVEFSGFAQGQIKCGVATNSISESALYLSGSGQLAAGEVSVAGNIEVSGSASLNPDVPPYLGGEAVDPYADLEVPALPATCKTDFPAGVTVSANNGVVVNNQADVTLTPGRYCNGLRLTNASNLTFAPGVYIIDSGEFKTTLNTAAHGNGVTFILTETAASNGTAYATINFTGSTQMTLTAPSSGPYKGILFYQDRNAPSFQGANLIEDAVLGSTQLNMSGAMYFPSQELKFSGSAQLQSNGTCLQIIGRKVTFLGSAQIQSDECEGAKAGNVKSILRMFVKLIE